MNDESGESMEPMEEVPLIRLGESLMETLCVVDGDTTEEERERERGYSGQNRR